MKSSMLPCKIPTRSVHQEVVRNACPKTLLCPCKNVTYLLSFAVEEQMQRYLPLNEYSIS